MAFIIAAVHERSAKPINCYHCFQATDAKKFPGKSVSLWPSKHASKFQSNPVGPPLSRSATMFPNKSVSQSQRKFHAKPADLFPRNSVTMFHASNVRMFRGNSADLFQGSIATMFPAIIV